MTTHGHSEPPCEVSVLIVCYNSIKDIRRCLSSLREHTGGVSYETLLINNADDGLEEVVGAEFPWVRVIPNESNLGFALGNNVLAEHARGRFILLLNPDTWIEEDAVSALVAFARSHPEGGAWGGVPVLPSGDTDPGCRQPAHSVRNVLFQAIGLRRLCALGPERTREFQGEVPALSGAFMLVDAEVWRRIGGFDPRFFLYSDEADLCERVRRQGKRVLMTGAARIVHNVGSGDPDAPQRLLARARGLMTYFHKHRSPAAAHFAGACLWLNFALRWLAGGALSALGRERGAKRRRTMAPLVASPSRWWGGWPDSPQAVPAAPAVGAGASP